MLTAKFNMPIISASFQSTKALRIIIYVCERGEYGKKLLPIGTYNHFQPGRQLETAVSGVRTSGFTPRRMWPWRDGCGIIEYEPAGRMGTTHA